MKNIIYISTLSLASFFPVSALHAANASDEAQHEEIVVTGTREVQSKDNIAESIGTINAAELQQISPSHPAEAVNRIPGVHVNNLGGEGHMTAIRHPITTSAAYLFLEDGVPTRPAGFFNHNGLYEINVPQAERIEVTKGPGTALYGSDAVGGIINSITQPSPLETALDANVELGSFGWKRALFSGGVPLNENHGMRLDLNLTDSEGYRDDSEYSRYSTTARADGVIGNEIDYKITLGYTDVDQSGVSSLEYNDYKNNTKKNFYRGEMGGRKVQAFRITSEFNYSANAAQLFSFTPFYRHNTMEMMPSWMLTYDPNIRDTEFQSVGALLKYRQRDKESHFEWIVGADIDYTPATYEEHAITVIRDGDFYEDYTTGDLNYDYDAEQTSVSPYIHGEWQASDKIRFTGGLRYDYFSIDYENNLSDVPAGFKIRPQDQSLDYSTVSPKFSALYKVSDTDQTYFNYRHAFRAPPVGSLFRPGSSSNSTELKPTKSDSFEIGYRGELEGSVSYEVALYYVLTKDEIISVIDDGSRQSVNAGETKNRGVEFGLNIPFSDEWNVNGSLSLSKQEYMDFEYIFARTESRNYAGFRVGKAPKSLGNITVEYQPDFLRKLRVEAEWSHVGSYYTDETNDNEYDGHDLFNLRTNYDLSDDWSVYARVMNLTDELYSTYTSNQVGSDRISYRPGMPRAYFVGMRLSF